MDSILMHRRTVLSKALGMGLLLLAKATIPVAAKDIPPFKEGEPDFFNTCRLLRKKYKEMEGQKAGAPDQGTREQIEADMKKLKVPWGSEGCEGEFGAIAIARIPPVPGQPVGPNPVAPPSVGVVTGGGASSKKPKKPKKPAQVAPPPAGTVRVASHPSGKRRRSGKR